MNFLRIGCIALENPGVVPMAMNPLNCIEPSSESHIEEFAKWRIATLVEQNDAGLKGIQKRFCRQHVLYGLLKILLEQVLGL